MTHRDAAARDAEFRAAYAALYPRIAGYAWNLTRDTDTAHDIAQETFARLFDRWDRIASNLARAAWRRQREDQQTTVHLARQALLEPTPPDATSAVAVRQTVAALPRRYRQLVLLHYFADLPLPQIAAALGRPVGTVKRQLSEARQLMAGTLEGAP